MSDTPVAFLKAHRIIHYLYPLLLFVLFVTLQTITFCTLQSLKPSKRIVRRNLLLFLQTAAIATYVLEAILMLAQSLVQKDYFSPEDSILYVLSSVVIWGVIELCLVDNSSPVWYPYCGSWLLALVAELCLLVLPRDDPGQGTGFHMAKVVVEIIRVSFLLALPISYWGFQRGDNQRSFRGDEESAGLLAACDAVNTVGNGTAYGATGDNAPEGVANTEANARMMKKIEESGNWWVYAKSFSILWKYLWPSEDRRLQASMVMVAFCLLAERGLNALVPHQLGVVTNSLSTGNGISIPWLQVSIYVVFRWLDSGSGIPALHRYLWIPVDQYASRSITTAAYNHVMSLSHDFHTNKKSVEIYSSVRQGRSVNGFIESVLFAVLPMLSDLCIAFAYFYYMFNAYMALIVAVVSIVYLYATAKLGATKNQIRRDYNTARIEEANVMCEAMSSWATVSYFNRIEYEQDRYWGAIKNYQKAELNYVLGITFLGVSQSLIFTVGLLGASFLAVYEVSRGNKPVGSFVTLLSYWAQLGSPLAFFANFYRKIQTQMLDAERLLELFQRKPSVVDKPDAQEFQLKSGEIEFSDVCFAYDPRKPAIKNMSFRVPGGSTVALVGETGGGKTTCLKLLFRFFDVNSGSITIDNQDIRDVTLWSLRENMGVVPQDPQLFNDTLMMNLKYANFDATDEQVYAACRAAAIHDKILGFPDSYSTKVGEHGVKLSGGELQRIAIARAILKNPKIVLLDEATSMVDMETERSIQRAFRELASNRTMFVIAHRLSTIMNANLIIVIKDGEIVEKGSHEELISAGGKYFQLWSKQLKNEQPKPSSGTPTESNYVNDLSPRSREQELKKVSGKSGTESCPKSNLDGHPKPKIEGVSLATNAFHVPILAPENGEILSNLRSGFDTDKISKSPSNRRNSVTFAADLPRSDSQSEARISGAQGILKGFGSVKNPEKQHVQLPRQVAPRTPSSLKPDAQEFIPNDLTSKGYAPQSTSGRTPVVNGTGGPLVPRESKSRVMLSALTDAKPVNDQSGNEGAGKEGDMHDQNGFGVDRIQALQEKIGKVLKSSEAKVREMEEGRAPQMSPAEEKGPDTSKISKINITMPNGYGGGSQCAIGTENSPASPTEPRGELQPEHKKKRRRNRRRSNRSKSTEEGDNMANGGPPDKTQEASLNGSLSLLSVRNISPRSCGGEEFPPTLDGNSSIDMKQKRRSLGGLKASDPKTEAGKAVTSLSAPEQTVSDEELPKKFKGKNGIGSASETNFRSALKEDLRPKLGDGGHMVSLSGPVEHPTPVSSVANRNTLREQNRRRSWGKSTALKGSWRRSDRDDRDEGTGTGSTDGA
ncbi:hypothetical protein C7212DRAFT_283744 [Tuber magnatum]|uniref:P-loop containing nucleoside triphosphate hydrolase protein n=1 Tax=Tuber magnatum TaxID=42249 RepID=A0A317SHC0_9PEZI|nr:hypothetical protein C7212DRAFT_283744 [Tuber magnatum]